MPETVLVTGGAGFIGSHLVDALLARGHRVRVLDCLDPQVHGKRARRPKHLDSGAEFLKGDVCDPKAVAAALKGVTVLFHEAAAVGVGQSMYQVAHYVRANTLGAAVVLQAVADGKHRLRKMIVASSMSIYGEGACRCAACGPSYPKLRPLVQLRKRAWEVLCPACGKPLEAVPTPEAKPLFPTSVYAVTKRDHEELFLSVGFAYGIPAVALRYFNTYGPRQALSNPYTGVGAIFSGRLLNRKPPVIFEDGRQTRDFTHVSDIVQANMLAMAQDGADGMAVNVGTGRALSILELAGQLAAHLGVQIKPEVVGKFRDGDVRHCFADISEIRRRLGYAPRIPFEKGIADLVGWVRLQKARDPGLRAKKELEARGLAK